LKVSCRVKRIEKERIDEKKKSLFFLKK